MARGASPVTYISEDDPPLLLLHGAEDKFVYLDQSERMERRYREAGLDVSLHVFEGAGHGWPRSEAGEKIVLEFLERCLGKPDADSTSPSGEPSPGGR